MKDIKEARKERKMSEKDVEEYIASQEVAIQDRLKAIRKIVKEVMPDYEEKISYGMPTFRGKRNLFHYATFKKHIGIFPTPLGIEAFLPQIQEGKYKYSKSGFQIEHGRDLPLDLIRDLAIWCRDHLDK